MNLTKSAMISYESQLKASSFHPNFEMVLRDDERMTAIEMFTAISSTKSHKINIKIYQLGNVCNFYGSLYLLLARCAHVEY